MTSFRCSPCSLNWPLAERYTRCKRCGESCSRMDSAVPMSQSEANHAEFDAFCIAHDERVAAEFEALVSGIATLPVESAPASASRFKRPGGRT